MESRRRWLCWDIVIMKNEEREQMNMFSFFQLKVLSAKSDSFNYSCMGRKYSKTLFWEQGETLWNNCNSNKWQAKYCWVFKTWISSLRIKHHCSTRLKDSDHFSVVRLAKVRKCLTWWFFSPCKSMKGYMLKTSFRLFLFIYLLFIFYCCSSTIASIFTPCAPRPSYFNFLRNVF